MDLEGQGAGEPLWLIWIGYQTQTGACSILISIPLHGENDTAIGNSISPQLRAAHTLVIGAQNPPGVGAIRFVRQPV
jgi:hypothetical protein